MIQIVCFSIHFLSGRFNVFLLGDRHVKTLLQLRYNISATQFYDFCHEVATLESHKENAPYLSGTSRDAAEKFQTAALPDAAYL
jgi:hypothetical protein